MVSCDAPALESSKDLYLDHHCTRVFRGLLSTAAPRHYLVSGVVTSSCPRRRDPPSCRSSRRDQRGQACPSSFCSSAPVTACGNAGRGRAARISALRRPAEKKGNRGGRRPSLSILLADS